MAPCQMTKSAGTVVMVWRSCLALTQCFVANVNHVPQGHSCRQDGVSGDIRDTSVKGVYFSFACTQTIQLLNQASCIGCAVGAFATMLYPQNRLSTNYYPQGIL